VNFYHKRRRRPEIIIVSLIDIFAILLIFVIVTTTFKTAQPEVTIKLPESKTAVAADKIREPVIDAIEDAQPIGDRADGVLVLLEVLADGGVQRIERLEVTRFAREGQQ
jgi:biopolymer transport protein ExbD